VNEETPGQSNPVPGPGYVPQADPLAAAPPASDPMAATPPTAPLYGSPAPETPTTRMYGTPPAGYPSAQPSYSAQPDYSAQPSYSAQPDYSPQPGYPAQPSYSAPGYPGTPQPGAAEAGYPTPGYPAPGYPGAGQPVPPQPYGAYPPAGVPGQPYPPAGFPGQPAGYPGQPFPPPGFPMYPQQTPRRNGAAIASLIFGVLGGVLISVICGIVALVQINRRGDRGKGMAVAGLVLSAFWVAGIALAIIISVASDSTTSTSSSGTGTGSVSTTRPTPTSTEAADVRTDKLVPGDCIASVSDDETVYDLPVVPCSQKHSGEVYSVTNMAAGAYPGDAKVEAEAEKRCDQKLDAYAIGKWKDAEFYYIFPSRRSWTSDRSITCVAVAPDDGTWTGSMVK
jgi:hypothetical protein